MQVTFSATVTFEIDNEPKGPHGKAILERALIDWASGKVIDQIKPIPLEPIPLESELDKHNTSIVEIFIHDPRGPKINHRYEDATMPVTEQDRVYRGKTTGAPMPKGY